MPRAADELFGEGATAEEAYGLLTVDVPADAWLSALTTARDELGCTFFDWLSAVDEPGTGLQICAHLVALPAPGTQLRRLLLRTTVPHEAPVLPTATEVYAGAAWHERETHEMFGVDFPGHPHLVPLLLPDTFEGHPLRKDFVLAARVAKAWPGAKEPGESGHGGPKRRQMLPPGVPDPNEWGPLKGQLPPAPTRERTRRATGDTPRRTRGAGAGSASQRGGATGTGGAPDGAAPREGTPPGAAAPRRPRRTRSASGGSASQRAAGQPPAAGKPPAQQERPADETGTTSGTTEEERSFDERATGARSRREQSGGGRPTGGTRGAPRSTDAPWHHARPAGEETAVPDDNGTAVPDEDGTVVPDAGGTGAAGHSSADSDAGRDSADSDGRHDGNGGSDSGTGSDNDGGSDSDAGDGGDDRGDGL
ncbi:NADH-quinone oxidoreductase subunit C [Streptomyces albus subsp. chlorinus]|nr:NADH-quinone oxidoreductase subunit C [Streptomyces albus]NSC23306.1 NADH-quinone oxidoreductase subunit C [Streptomyces albus subsp. chlorinus]